MLRLVKRGGLVCGRRGGCSAYEAGGCAGRPARAAAMVGSDTTPIGRMLLDQISGVNIRWDLPTDWVNMYLRGVTSRLRRRRTVEF